MLAHTSFLHLCKIVAYYCHWTFDTILRIPSPHGLLRACLFSCWYVSHVTGHAHSGCSKVYYRPSRILELCSPSPLSAVLFRTSWPFARSLLYDGSIMGSAIFPKIFSVRKKQVLHSLIGLFYAPVDHTHVCSRLYISIPGLGYHQSNSIRSHLEGIVTGLRGVLRCMLCTSGRKLGICLRYYRPVRGRYGYGSRNRPCALESRGLLEEGSSGRKCPLAFEIGGRFYMVYRCLGR